MPVAQRQKQVLMVAHRGKDSPSRDVHYISYKTRLFGIIIALQRGANALRIALFSVGAVTPRRVYAFVWIVLTKIGNDTRGV